MRRRTAWLVVAASIALTASACAGGDGDAVAVDGAQVEADAATVEEEAATVEVDAATVEDPSGDLADAVPSDDPPVVPSQARPLHVAGGSLGGEPSRPVIVRSVTIEETPAGRLASDFTNAALCTAAGFTWSEESGSCN